MMASAPTVLDVLWGFSVVANAAAACRLCQLGLHRIYRFFFAYLVFAATRSLILLPFSVRSNIYVMIYAITAPMLWLFYVLVALTRNIIVHCIVYTIFFMGISMTIHIRNVVGHELMRELNEIVMVLSGACYLVWIFAITEKGESRIVTLRHNWTVTDEQRLIHQLDNINATLLRASRREFGRGPRATSGGRGRIRSRGEVAMNREF